MSVVNTIDATAQAGRDQLAKLRAALSLTDLLIGRSAELDAVQHVVDAVRQRGDQALIELTERFDGVRLTADQFRVTPKELAWSRKQLDPSFTEAVGPMSHRFPEGSVSVITLS